MRRTFEVGFWIALYAGNAVFNSIISRLDHPDTAAWEPWCWECSSALMSLVLVAGVARMEDRWPLRMEAWRTSLPWHLLASIAYSLLHVAGMIALRKLVYAAVGGRYDFGDWWPHFGYEYLKDVRSYFGVAVTVAFYRFWRLRRQGEARLLDAPDQGPPVEPVDRPERFLVRKLGREFLLAAGEIEWAQAAGNYVNLHVRGRDYPLRSTMAVLEARLDPARFLRVHRGYIVNLDCLAEIEPLESGDARLKLRDGALLPCSRRYRAQLRERSGEPAATDVRG
ncbi:MAG: LytTR family DNA-binding domain-containing protein [Fulvimonas sp.]|nr:LytTR family DNA-binding domain-containing protein [Fulvimonas sp.]